MFKSNKAAGGLVGFRAEFGRFGKIQFYVRAEGWLFLAMKIIYRYLVKNKF
jgi:hypothetical protein